MDRKKHDQPMASISSISRFIDSQHFGSSGIRSRKAELQKNKTLENPSD